MKKEANNRLFWILQVFGWTAYGLMMYFLFSKNKPYDYTSIALFFLSYLLGLLMTSFALRYLYRFLRKKIPSIQWLMVTVFFLVLIIVPLWYFIDVRISMIWWDTKHASGFFDKITIMSFLRDNFNMYIIYYGWTALYFGINYRIGWQEEKKRSEEAFHLAQKAQFQMLRYQLNPHFLFNSLNSIRALVDEDSRSAKQMITELSEFLRYSLVDKDIAFKTLREELDALKLYLSIEKKRFEEKLQIQYDISPETEKMKVPSFLIHPIIENAIKYGMKTSRLPLELNIRSLIKDEYLIIKICNSGKWIERQEYTDSYGTGTGIDNVINRLENSYRENYDFSIDRSDNKVCVKIAIITDEKATR